jgi:hypothetical protein
VAKDASRARLSSTLSSSPVRSITFLSLSGLEAKRTVKDLGQTENVTVLTRGCTWEDYGSRNVHIPIIRRPRVLSTSVPFQDGRCGLVHIAVVLSEDSPCDLWVTITHHGSEKGELLLLSAIHSEYREVGGSLSQMKRKRVGTGRSWTRIVCAVIG